MPDAPTGLTDYTNTPSVVPPVWDKTKGPGGYPMGAFSDVAPMVSPMERFVQGLGAISGGKFGIIRSRQDVWKEAHDTQSYLDKYLQNQQAGAEAKAAIPNVGTMEAARVAHAKLQTGQDTAALPNVGTMEDERVAKARAAKTEAEQRGSWLANHNLVAEESAQQGRKFESEHPWLSDDEMQRQEGVLGYTHVGGSDDTQSRIDFITKNVPADQQAAVKTAMAEKAMGLSPGYLSRGAGRTTENFDALHDKILNAGLQNQYEVGSDAYGYKIVPKRAFAAKDIAAYKIRADQLKQTSDQISRERRILETDMRRKPSAAQEAMIKSRLEVLDTEESSNKDDWKDLLENRPDEATEDPNELTGASQGAKAGRLLRPPVQPMAQPTAAPAPVSAPPAVATPPAQQQAPPPQSAPSPTRAKLIAVRPSGAAKPAIPPPPNLDIAQPTQPPGSTPAAPDDELTAFTKKHNEYTQSQQQAEQEQRQAQEQFLQRENARDLLPTWKGQLEEHNTMLGVAEKHVKDISDDPKNSPEFLKRAIQRRNAVREEIAQLQKRIQEAEETSTDSTR